MAAPSPSAITITGTAGNDTIIGSHLEEVVFGGAGALFLCTQGGNIVTDMGFGPAPYVALSLEEAREVVDSIEITIAPGSRWGASGVTAA